MMTLEICEDCNLTLAYVTVKQPGKIKKDVDNTYDYPIA